MEIITKLQPATTTDLYNISMSSAKTKDKELLIYEKGKLSDVVGKKRAEKIRQVFLKNKIQVKQITNNPNLPKFSENDEFINKCMSFRFIPKNVLNIENETLIFDDIVAVYRLGKINHELAIIKDKALANNQKQLFINLWEQGILPKLGFAYKPNHVFYNSIDFKIFGKQFIIYPDRDAGKAYVDWDYAQMQKYLENIVVKNKIFFDTATYCVGFIWNFESSKMIDLWKFSFNHVDDYSGPLSEVKVFKNGKPVDNLGMASGNTFLVLGYEEKLRRQSKDLKDYLAGPTPKLPLELSNGKDFFKSR